MMRIATTFALFVAAEAARCRTKCSDPFKLNKDECKCECASGCESYQTQDANSCACTDNPCDACAPGDGGTATATDFKQAAQPSCECSAADGNDPCDAIYGGKFTQADGTACPTGGDEPAGGDGDGDDEGGEGDSGASQLLAGAMVLAATLLI